MAEQVRPLMADEPLFQSAYADPTLLVAFTRMEAKVDVALAQHGADIRVAIAQGADHETRIRAIELTPTVSPRVLWASVVSGAGLVLAALPLVQTIYK